MTIEQLGIESLEQHRADGIYQRAQQQAHDLHAVASEFESLFVKQMLQSMRNTLQPENNYLYGGFAEAVFQDMVDTEYALLLAKTETFGIAEMIIAQYEQNSGS